MLRPIGTAGGSFIGRGARWRWASDVRRVGGGEGDGGNGVAVGGPPDCSATSFAFNEVDE